MGITVCLRQPLGSPDQTGIRHSARESSRKVAHDNKADVVIRPMEPDEGDALGKVFYHAVRDGAARAYSEEQRAAWAYEAPSGPKWNARLSDQSTVVAEIDRRVVGFMTLHLKTGHLDLAFILAEAQGQGVSDALYIVLENQARTAGLKRMTSDASHLAKPFFLRHGWRILGSRIAERSGVTLQNWQMEKALVAGIAT
ncbi:MAG: GNAT family N-acetyltransferase [Boseongicola sp.]|nr:MAG: GNAT family N-acetyltransferase [Boseongicola sp.]